MQSRRKKQGQQNSYNRGAGATLACWFGIPTMKYLSDEDAEALADILGIIIRQVRDEAFNAGVAATSVYNYDERLVAEGQATAH